ncbi:hypothetical protein SLS56_003315 [Neofusicoccum ribis]|uniref:Uncharacterized protein n=1 Tax=Neofusicoccum ribis TaxID=45134 RepID=A0ABR3SZT4_9PEZI
MRPTNESDIRLDELVIETANLLSESHTLKTLHLSPPLLGSAVPFAVKRLDSLTMPITNSLHHDPDFAKLLKLFQIPSLRKVELDQMLRLNCVVPDDCRQPGTSNVAHLEFSLCGPVSEEIAHLLSWPKDLQTLVFKEGMAEGLNRFVYDSGDTNALKLQEALRPVEKTLEDLNLDLVNTYSDGLTDGPLPNDAFQSFTKLRRLRIPINMLIEFEDDEDTYDDNELIPHGSTWSIHSQFPHCIEELEFVISEEWWWGDWETNVPSKETKELFAYVSGLADGNEIHYPNLIRVLISNELGDLGYGYNDTRVERDYVREFIDRLQSSGISVSIFHRNL